MPALPDSSVDQDRNAFNSHVLKTFSKNPELREHSETTHER
jgi:hypothetical protein